MVYMNGLQTGDATTSALAALIEPFLHSVATGQIEVCNEFSLQHELGFFLRQPFPRAFYWRCHGYAKFCPLWTLARDRHL